MKKTERSLSIGHDTGYGSIVILWLSGLVLLLSSCDKEGLPEGKKRSGKRIAVSTHIAGVTEGTTDDITRGTEEEAVTETAPIGNGLWLDMHLEPVPASQLRATTPLATGKKYRVIALDADDQTYVSHGDFTVGQTNPTSPFEVIQGETYDFICVSLNSTSLPTTNHLVLGETPDFSDISGTGDLLYAKVTKTIATEEDATLSFTLVHKFNELTLVVDCNSTGGGITSVSTTGFRLDSIYNNNTMNWEGTVTPGTKIANTSVYFKKPNPDTHTSGDPTWTSEPDTLFRGNTGSFGIIISGGAITTSNFGSRPGTTEIVRFTKPLLPGKKYKLTLKFQEPKFAASNIYWDGSKLTFVPYSATPSSVTPVDANKYQGVYFKFGSLIGISPIDAWNNSTTLLYVPPTGGSSSWYITSADGSLASLPAGISGTIQDHTTIETGVWTGTDYTAIPYASGGVPESPIARRGRYVINMPLDSLAEFKGDICKYIDPAYRLPMAYEFGVIHVAYWADGNTHSGWTKVGTTWSTVTSDKADGTYIGIATGIKFGSTENFFPLSGARNPDNGMLLNATGIGGNYWSSSSLNASLAYGLRINTNGVAPGNGDNCRYGWSVRCILQE